MPCVGHKFDSCGVALWSDNSNLKGQNILNHIELIILVSIHRGLHKLSLSQIEKVRVMFREPKFVPRALRMQRILMVNEDRKEQKALQLCKLILISTQFVNVKNKRSSYCTTAFLSINVIYRTLTLYNFWHVYLLIVRKEQIRALTGIQWNIYSSLSIQK